MAFNISITKNKKVNFEKLHSLCTILDRKFVTVFPICNENSKKHHGIGISVNMNKEYEKFFTDLESFLSAVIKQNFNVIELYNGERIESKKDIQKLLEFFK